MCLPQLAVLLIFVHASVARHHHLHIHDPPHSGVATTSRNIDNVLPEKLAVIDAATGISYNPYSKNHPGRHVCTNQKEVPLPVKTKQSFCKPTYKKYQQRCNDNQLCSGVRVVYETGYRDVVITKQSKLHTYACCPGWKQVNNRSNGCNKPLCSNGCLNGGSCVKPDTCSCPQGFLGNICENDVDECKEQKPCDQICINTNGSYKCECRENFTLLFDGQSCKKDDDEGPGFEAKELEFESLDQRIFKLESMLGETDKMLKTKTEIKEMKNDLESINKDVGILKNKVNEVESYKTDLNFFKTKLHQMEKKSSKIDELSARYDKMKKCAFYNKICI